MSKPKISLICFLALLPATVIFGGEYRVISVDNFSPGELYCRSIEVTEALEIDIYAIGSGWQHEKKLAAYGWIIPTNEFTPVWVMDWENTDPVRGSDYLREYDRSIELEAGRYDVYFYAGTTTGSYNISIEFKGIKEAIRAFIKALKDHEEEREDLEDWDATISIDNNHDSPEQDLLDNYQLAITTDVKKFRRNSCEYSPRNVIAQVIEPEHNLFSTVGFSLTKPITVEIIAQGEYAGYQDNFADFAWLIDADSSVRVWALNESNSDVAGGARKNRIAIEELELDKGNYLLYYVTDDSHAFADWNYAPPYNPLAYGVTIRAVTATDVRYVKNFHDQLSESALLAIIHPENNDYVSKLFRVDKHCEVRLYALGEYDESADQFADYAWIEKIGKTDPYWTMTKANTEYAGGADKNRMFDGLISLAPGDYLLCYLTDDSHTYDDFNAAPPYDPANYGVTIWGATSKNNSCIREVDKIAQDQDILAQITRAGDNIELKRRFRLKKPVKVNIYAIGEGDEGEMYDYGWIEDANSGEIIWEMTYRKTKWAGGADKNRLVDNNILLDAGKYILWFVSDDSHSFAGWNAARPRSPTRWGITITAIE